MVWGNLSFTERVDMIIIYYSFFKYYRKLINTINHLGYFRNRLGGIWICFDYMLNKLFLYLRKDTLRVIKMFFYYHRKFEEYLQFLSDLLWDLSLVTKDRGKCIIYKGHNWFSQATFWRTNTRAAFYLLIATHMISAFFKFRDVNPRFFAVYAYGWSYSCTLLIIFWSLTAGDQHRFLYIHFKLLKLWRRNNDFSLVLQVMWNL